MVGGGCFLSLPLKMSKKDIVPAATGPGRYLAIRKEVRLRTKETHEGRQSQKIERRQSPINGA